MYRIGARGDTDQARASPTPEHAQISAHGRLVSMARRGVWELSEISLRYCVNGGSSRGVREFVETKLPLFAKANPQIQFTTTIRGGHPFVRGKYVTGYNRQLGLKNHSCEEVEERFGYLRNTLGMKTPKHNEVGFGVFERNRVSVQGFWRNQKDLGPPVLPSEIELRERRRREYNLQSVLDEFGAEGVVRITQKLLERQEAKRASALAALPVVEKVRATE